MKSNLLFRSLTHHTDRISVRDPNVPDLENLHLQRWPRTKAGQGSLAQTPADFSVLQLPKADKGLKRLAEDTGGRAFFSFKAEDLSESV